MHLSRLSSTGALYDTGCDVPPLTKATPAKPALSGLSQALAIGKKFSYVPLGAGIGAVTASVLLLLEPELQPDALSHWNVIGMAAGAGVVLERLANYVVGRWVDPVLKHWGSRWETKLELDKLNHYLRRGLISEEEGRRIAARIAKRDVAGGPRPVGNRPATYRKRRLPSSPSPAQEPRADPPSAEPGRPSGGAA